MAGACWPGRALGRTSRKRRSGHIGRWRWFTSTECTTGAISGIRRFGWAGSERGYRVFAGKPIIGMLGGIGSGKSYVARMFGEEGCLVINSDEQVTRAYEREDVKQVLLSWWGPEVLDEHGRLNRKVVAR